jgi:nucleoid DNA-binding protein
MTKVNLIKKIHTEHKSMTQKLVADILNTVFDTIKDEIHINDKFTYPGFGTFTIQQRQDRIGRNPKNGDKIIIKASKTVRFKPAKLLKSKINE